jgi:hypothetical protein
MCCESSFEQLLLCDYNFKSSGLDRYSTVFWIAVPCLRTTMDKLKADIRSMHSVVEQRSAAGQAPSQQQLTDFTKNISVAIEKVISALPVRIKDICRSNFADMLGWSLRTKSVTKPELFTAANLLVCLTVIANELDNWQPVVEPTEEELADLSVACTKLWDLDTHRLVAGQDYVINLQQGKNYYEDGDAAREPLFTFFDEKVLERPTYKAFFNLLDNYSAEEGVLEAVSSQELAENTRFLAIILDTSVMQYVLQYLYRKGKIQTNERDAVMQLLNQVWFELYCRGRGTVKDSSGFEHVMVGEVSTTCMCLLKPRRT